MKAKSRTANREVTNTSGASPRFRELAVQIWPIDKLIPYARNARTHTDEQVAQVAASIVEFGWTNPILAGADGVIIAGHARLAAARKLRMNEVPVIVLDGLSETQRRALILADNRTAELAQWDWQALGTQLKTLKMCGFDLDGQLGWRDFEADPLKIAAAIKTHLRPAGVGVVIRAHHLCMGCRGVRKPQSQMVTSALHGRLRTDTKTRAEFLALSHG